MYNVFSTTQEKLEIPNYLLFRIILLRLKGIKTPITDQFTIELQKQKKGFLKDVWYKSQGDHWITWLIFYNGAGLYQRKNHHRTSEFVYNHINCAPMQLWLGEAVGVPKEQLQFTVKMALKGDKYQTQCAILRKNIPWSIIKIYCTK